MPITSTTMTLPLGKLPYNFPTEARIFTPNEANERSVRILKELWGDFVEARAVYLMGASIFVPQPTC